MPNNIFLETKYTIAVQTIKTVILQSQYQAIKLLNKEQLALYYGIGRYISQNSRNGYWGTGAIAFISKYLQPIITQYFIDNKSEIWLLFLIAHSKR